MGDATTSRQVSLTRFATLLNELMDVGRCENCALGGMRLAVEVSRLGLKCCLVDVDSNEGDIAASGGTRGLEIIGNEGEGCACARRWGR